VKYYYYYYYYIQWLEIVRDNSSYWKFNYKLFSKIVYCCNIVSLSLNSFVNIIFRIKLKVTAESKSSSWRNSRKKRASSKRILLRFNVFFTKLSPQYIPSPSIYFIRETCCISAYTFFLFEHKKTRKVHIHASVRSRRKSRGSDRKILAGTECAVKRTSESHGEIRCIAVSIGTFVLKHIEKRRVVTRGAMYRWQHLSRGERARGRGNGMREQHTLGSKFAIIPSLESVDSIAFIPTSLGANESRCLLIAAAYPACRTNRRDRKDWRWKSRRGLAKYKSDRSKSWSVTITWLTDNKSGWIIAEHHHIYTEKMILLKDLKL